jgi:hypothetical protein
MADDYDDDYDEEPNGRSRRDDPDTAKHAGDTVAAEVLWTMILGHLRACAEMGATCTEMSYEFTIKRDTLSPRMPELMRTGQVVRTAHKRLWPGRGHKPCYVYKLAEHIEPSDLEDGEKPTLADAMAAAAMKYLDLEADETGWNGAIVDLGVQVHAESRTAVRRLARFEATRWVRNAIERRSGATMRPAPGPALREETCKYIYTEPDRDGFRFCGAPVAGGERCEKHTVGFF